MHLTIDIKKYADTFKKPDNHKAGVACFFLNKQEEVDVKILEEMISDAMKNK